MKKILVLIFTALVIVGCNQTTDNIDAPLGGNVFTTSYQTVIIDSCEYVSGTNRLSHKGNCRFYLERRQKELKELVKQLNEK